MNRRLITASTSVPDDHPEEPDTDDTETGNFEDVAVNSDDGRKAGGSRPSEVKKRMRRPNRRVIGPEWA